MCVIQKKNFFVDFFFLLLLFYTNLGIKKNQNFIAKKKRAPSKSRNEYKEEIK